jgi:hypothetical protein
MAKYAAPWFIQNELSKFIVRGNKSGLLIKRFPWWWIYPTYDYISDFTFGMTTDNMDSFYRTHVYEFRAWGLRKSNEPWI